MDRWRRVGAERLHRCAVFDLDRVRFEPPGRGLARDFYVIDAPDWINVVPVTADRRVVLVRQYRFGIESPTLEIPGGMCDGSEPPLAAASRELVEETGYESSEIVELGWVHPNPAIQANRCHSFLALDARPSGPQRPDDDESLEVELTNLDEIPRLIRDGVITHSLVIAAFHLLGLRKLV